MIRIIAILLLSCNLAVAQISQQTIVDEITANLPTNNQQLISAELLRNTLNQMTSAIFQNQGLSGFTITGTPSIGQTIIATSSTTASWQSIGGGQVTTVTNADGSLLISPTTGNVVGSLNVGHVNTWLALQNFSVGGTSLTLSSTDNSTNIATTAFVQTAITTSAPSTSTFTSPSALANATIPASVLSANVTAMANSGTSTCGLRYIKGTSTPTGQYQEILNTASSIYWEPSFENSPVKACQFGTIADGSYNQSTGAITGTDNTLLIQNSLDYAMRNKFQTVCLNDGNYKTNDTIAQGWGQALYTLSLQACNIGRNPYSFVAGPPGVTLMPTQTDRCAINITGARQSSIKAIQFLGQNIAFGNSLPQTLPWPTTAAGWLNPTITPAGGSPGGLTRHTPYAAICIDAFISTAPSPPYPNQTFPTWTGVVTQYGQDPSSDIVIEDVFVQGFAIGVNLQSNGDANGDFIKIRNYACVATVYCASIGNSQARAVVIDNLSASNDFTLLTNTQFGTLNGELGGHMINASCSQCFQLVDISTSLAGLTIQDTYMEAGVKIGNISGSNSVTLRNCSMNFETTLTGVAPVALIEATNGTTIKFDDCKLGNTSRIETLVHVPSGGNVVTYSGGELNGAIKAGALFGASGAGAQNAVNYTGGFLAGAFTYPNQTFANRLIWEGQTFASFMSTATGGTTLTNTSWTRYPVFGQGNRGLWSQAMQGFVDAVDNKYWTFSRGPSTVVLDMTGGQWTSALTSAGCDTWTGQWAASQQGTQAGTLQLGDIFYHQTTGTIWVVESIGVATPTNFPITLRQHNNMLTDNTGACTVNNLSTTMPSGNAMLIHVNVTIPGTVYYCDFATGSINLTNCNRGDGVGNQLQSVWAAGDKFWASTFNDTTLQWPFTSNTAISSVTNGSPGSAVLTLTASKSGTFPLLPLPTDMLGLQTNTIVALPTPSASGGTCAAAGAQAGNQVRGTVTLSGACAATNTVTLTFVIHATNGWFCTLNDRTAPTILFPQTSSSATTAVFTAQGTSGAADVLGFECSPY